MRRTVAAPAVLAGALLAALLPAPLAGATPDATARRLSGADRYATAAAVALADRSSAAVAVLARGDDPADALAGSTLAGAVDGPVLLTPQDRLDPSTADALTRLGVDEVRVLGGPAAVGEPVLAELRRRGLAVSRVAGSDRYATAQAVAQACGAECGDGDRTALLVNGTRPADAAAASPVAAGETAPLLLTETDRVPAATLSALEDAGTTTVLVVGGPAVVSEAVVSSLRSRGLTVRRFAGSSRQGTAAVLARYARDELGWPVEAVVLSRGDALADALAGGPLAGRAQAPLLLTAGTSLGEPARIFLEESRPTGSRLDVLGGANAVPQAVVEAALRALGVAAGCALGGPPAAPGTPTTITRGLQLPWGLAVLPDGSALVSERDTARLKVVHPDGRVGRPRHGPGRGPRRRGRPARRRRLAGLRDRPLGVRLPDGRQREQGRPDAVRAGGRRRPDAAGRHPQGEHPQRRPARLRPGRDAVRRHRRRGDHLPQPGPRVPRRQGAAPAPRRHGPGRQPVRRLAGVEPGPPQRAGARPSTRTAGSGRASSARTPTTRSTSSAGAATTAGRSSRAAAATPASSTRW